MRRSAYLAMVALVAAMVGCEEGPDQIFKPFPNGGDPEKYNGIVPGGFLADGTHPFEGVKSEQQTGTVVICEADETARRWAGMVKEPIMPTSGAGGLDLRGKPVWAGLTIDAAQQQLCQAYVYGSEIVYWGDNAEMLAIYDGKTRLISRLVTLTGYEGTIKAGPFEIGNNLPIQKDGQKLNNATSDDNLRAMNVELLKKFRPEVNNPEQRDCVALNTCYTLEWYTLKRFVFEDLMLDFAVEPEAEKIDHIGINLKRSFELSTTDVVFEPAQGTTAGVAPLPKIPWTASCNPTLGSNWKHVLDNCLGIDPPEKALTRPAWSNEAFYADMGGLTLYMTRPTLKTEEIIPDDARPAATDEIVGMGFSTEYEGAITFDSAQLYQGYAAAVADAVEAQMPALGDVNAPVDLSATLALMEPEDGAKLKVGTQRIVECPNGADSCVSAGTLIGRTQQIVAEAASAAGTVLSDELKDPNFYVELYLRQLLKVFNGDVEPSASDIYFYVNDDSAQVMTGVLALTINNERYSVRAVYHNKSDQLMWLFFKRGALRTEHVLWKDAELKQYDDSVGDGVFRLWNLAKSPRLGLGSKIAHKSDDPTMRKAIIDVKLGAPTPVLVSYHKQNSQSGFGIPVEGQRDVFTTAASYSFPGNVVGATLYAKDGIVLAVASGAFYDKLDFCGVQVGRWDSVEQLMKKLPASCDKIVSYSDNGKLISAISTYVEEDPFKVGLRLWVTAGRIDSAYYWAEQ